MVRRPTWTVWYERHGSSTGGQLCRGSVWLYVGGCVYWQAAMWIFFFLFEPRLVEWETNSTSSGRQGNNCAFRSSRNIKGYLCSSPCHWAVLLFLLTSFVWPLNYTLCQNAAHLVNVVMFLLTVKYRGLMRESSFLRHTRIKSPLGSSVSCLTWNAYWRLYSLHHNLALYCKSWQNWMKIWLWVLFHGHFMKISLNITCTSGFLLNRYFWNGLKCFIRFLGIETPTSYSTLLTSCCSLPWRPFTCSQSICPQANRRFFKADDT